MQWVLMHELAHCLDNKQDINPNTGEIIHQYAIAPQERKTSLDFTEYQKAEDSKASTVWKEAFADIFATGFWRLNNPTDYQKLYENILEKRTIDDSIFSTGDTDHDTTCWITYSNTQPAPEKMSDLVNWENTIRSTAPRQ